MSQNRAGTVLNLIVLVLLTAGFFAGARTAFQKLHKSVSSAAATATPFVLFQPTPSPARTAGTPGQTSSAPTKATALLPTSTPLAQSAKVSINTSASSTNSLSSLPSATSQIWCIATLPNVTVGTPIMFRFQRLATPGDYFHYPEPATGTTQSAYLEGPLERGQWRCVVEVNGKLAGVAPFTVT
jgi:hypothetical protein